MGDRKIISIDGMGGDHAPKAVIEGLEIFASERPDVEFLLHGDEQALKPLLASAPNAAPRTRIRHAEHAVGMDMKPAQAVRVRDSSMRNAIEAVKAGEAIAAVSAGNTGALMAVSKIVLRMVEGVRRPALVGTWPTRSGVCAVLDLGADIAAEPEQLVEFAVMGAAFARAVHHKARPSVGLLNIGSEDVKGHEEIREAARLLRASSMDFDFAGFVEGDDISRGATDVVVTDGFTGNVALKAAEGAARMISETLSSELRSSLVSKLGAVLAMPALNRLRSRYDPRRVNGAVFLGLNGVVVKSHGGTDGFGFSRAVSVAADMGDSRFKTEVLGNLSRLVAAEEVPVASEASEESA